MCGVADDEHILPGGRSNRGRVTRRGAVVLRPAVENRNVETVLTAVSSVFDGAPRVLGRDDTGRLLLTWVEGGVSSGLAVPPASDYEAVGAVGALLRRLHDATASVASHLGVLHSGLADPSGATDVVCHCDGTPGNVVFRRDRPVALIDWEYASLGRRAWDLAIALRSWAPLLAPENLSPADQELDRVGRARALLDGYGAESSLRAETVSLLGTTQDASASNAVRVMSERGPQQYEAWLANGGLDRLSRDRAWLDSYARQLRAELV